MPAQSSDVISSAILASMSTNKKVTKGEVDSVNFNAVFKQILEADIEFEPTPTYSSSVLTDLKSKYIVLSTSGSSSNAAKSDESKSNDRSDIVIKKIVKEQCALPTPKRVLYPLDSVQVGWKASVPVGSGFMNLGNTCYLNSTLQALFHVPAFVNWILNDSNHSSKCESINGMTHSECLICAMAKTLQQSHTFTGSSMKPIQIYSKLKSICKHLVHGHQEDAHEFLRYLMEGMEKSYLTIFNCTKLDSYSKETTPLNQIFGGYMRTEVTCLVCHHISTTFQHFQDLLLDIRTASSVEDALETYFSRERLGDGDQAYFCEHCKRRVAASKKFSLERPPKVLCIQLKRFSAMGGKNNKQIGVKQYLDLTKYRCRGQMSQGSKYKLVSLITHLGSSSSCGHYTAVGLTAAGSYYLYDDSSVKPVSLATVLSTNAYILMYEQDISSRPATPNKVPNNVNGFSNGVKTEQTNGVSPLRPMFTPKIVVTSAPSSSSTAPVSLSPKAIPLSPKATGARLSPLPSPKSSPGGSRLSSHSPRITLSPKAHSLGHKGTPNRDAQSEQSTSILKRADRPIVQIIESRSPKVEVASKKGRQGSPSSREGSPASTGTNSAHSSPMCSLVPYLSESSDSESDTVPSSSTKHSSSAADYGQSGGKPSQGAGTKDQTPTFTKQLNGSFNPPYGKVSHVVKSSPSSSSHSGANSETLSNGVTTEVDVKGRTWEVTPVREEEAPCPTSIATSGRWNVTSTDKQSRETSQEKPSSSLNSVPKPPEEKNASWDNGRSNVVDSLMKYSNRGYGVSGINSWNGGRSELDKEVEKERMNLKRPRNSYDDDYDRGKVKRARKFEPFRHESRGHNRFQAMQNRKNNWSRNNFYRQYTAVDRHKAPYYRNNQNNQYNRWH